MGKMVYVDYYLEKDQKEYLDNLLGKCGTIKVNGKVTYYLEEKQKKAIDALINKEGIIDEDKQQWPSDGDKYYCLDDDGIIFSSIWNSICDVVSCVDIGRHEIGNIFKTKEEAEFAYERLKVLNQLKSLSDDDQEWDAANRHYQIVYNMFDDEFNIWAYYRTKVPHDYWFKSKESAEAAIKIIGEDKLKKYVFNAKEN